MKRRKHLFSSSESENTFEKSESKMDDVDSGELDVNCASGYILYGDVTGPVQPKCQTVAGSKVAMWW